MHLTHNLITVVRGRGNNKIFDTTVNTDHLKSPSHLQKKLKIIVIIKEFSLIIISYDSFGIIIVIKLCFP